MEKVNNQQLGGFVDTILSYITGSVICIEPNTNQRVAIQSSHNLAPVIDLQFPFTVPHARLVGRWIIECKNKTIFLRENNSSGQDDCIIVTFQQADISVRVKCITEEGNENLLIPKVRGIYVYPREVGKMKIETSEMRNNTDILNPETTERSHFTPANDVTVESLKDELERAKTISDNLQKIVSGKLDDILRLANEKKEFLSDVNHSKLRDANKISNEVVQLAKEVEDINREIGEKNGNLTDLRRIIQEQKDEVARIQKQIDEQNVQKEILDLECDEAGKQLDELKLHLNLDADTIKLLEDGYRLKHGTISKSLSEIEKELKKVEERIVFILKFRTKFNHVVEDAILNSDGTILTSDETGGNSDGI